MKNRIVLIIIVATIIKGYWSLSAQQSYRLAPDESFMKIEGTSSIHDWEMDIERISCEMNATIGNPSIKITSASFTGKTSSIVSHSSIMDKKAHNALKADIYPEIKFRLLLAEPVPISKNTFQGRIDGELTIAGITKTITVPFKGKIEGKENLSITGSKKIDMTEFGIQPPTAMLGTLKTGKEVTVLFSLYLIK